MENRYVHRVPNAAPIKKSKMGGDGMKSPKCKVCNKPIKEDTDGDDRYCQGHSFWEYKVDVK